MNLAWSTRCDGYNTLLSLSKEILLVNLTNILRCFLINLFLLICQTSVFSTVDIKLSLSLLSSSRSNNKWSTVWSLVPQEHVCVTVILNWCKCDLILPWPITMVVKLWVMFIFIFNLSVTIGKYSFLIFPFVVWSHSLCHFSTLISLSSLITTLFRTFL